MTKNDESKKVPGPAPFESSLEEGWQRFLAHVAEHAFENGRRSPEDFIRHFPPDAIMQGLKDKPDLRANILVICTGVRMKIAMKKSASSCAEDLQIALEEDVADAETVVTLFDPDDRIRYLDKMDLWKYLTEGDFWKAEAKSDPKAAEHLAYILERALSDGLINHREVVEEITTEQIVDLLPREELQKIIAGALAASHDGKPFSETDLLAMTPPESLVQHIPLADLWNKVVASKIAVRHELSPKPIPKPGAPADATEPPGSPDESAAEVKGAAGPPPGEESPLADLDMDIDDLLDFDQSADAPKKKKKKGKSVNPPAS